MLAEGAMDPWPYTLVTLATGAEERLSAGTLHAYAALVKGLVRRNPNLSQPRPVPQRPSTRLSAVLGAPALPQVWRDPFSVGARVVAWRQKTSHTGAWLDGIVVNKLPGRRYDVRLVNGDVLPACDKKHVLTPSAGGAGAILRAAAAMGATQLVDALLRKGYAYSRSA